jgi:hypothetical protein
MTYLSDIDHYWGSDISSTPAGDLAVVQTTKRGVQRVLRRLMTNPGEYIFHPTYGAGLPRKIGKLVNIPEITALIRSQMLLESVVARSPAPIVNVSIIPNSLGGGIAVAATYTDAYTGQTVPLNFNVSA